MPFENEAGCVLTPADSYESFRRENCAAKVSDKCVDHIYGINADGSELHSLRYRFDEGWTNGSAETHCKSHDGTFESGSEEESMSESRDRIKYMHGPFIGKAADGESGQTNLIRYCFTSDNMDEGGDIITREATEKATERWRQWRNIRLQHDNGRPIGKAVRIGKSDGLDWNQMDVRVDDPEVAPLVEGDDPVLGAASVGIIVNDFEVNDDEEAKERAGFWEPWIINDYDLVEISLVDHPMNYDAKRIGEVDMGRSRLLFRRRDLLPEEGREAQEKDGDMTKDKILEQKEETETLETPTGEVEAAISEPEVTNDVTPNTDVPEGGDPDLALVTLTEIKDMLEGMGAQIGAIHKSVVVVEEEQILEDEVPVEEEVEPDAEEPVVEEEAEVEPEEAPVESEDEPAEDAEPVELGRLGEMVERIYERLIGSETAEAEVDSEDQPDLEKLVEQKVAEILEKKAKLQPRKSVAIEEEAEEPTEETPEYRNPRERLRSTIRSKMQKKEE